MIQDIETRPPSIFLVRFFFFFVVLFLFIALLNNQWELSLLGTLIVVMVCGVKLWSRLSLQNLDYRPHIKTDRLFPGDAIDITVRLENAKALPVWIQVHVNVDAQLRSHVAEGYLTRDAWVLWYQQVNLKYDLTARRRGVFTIGPLEIRAGDLLGFFSRGRVWRQTRQIVVYPRLRQINPTELPRRDFFGSPGARHPVEDPVYLLGTRDYQYLRPAKFIHWKASARLNRLQEKLCEPSAQKKVLLVIDVTQFEQEDHHDAFEEMLEAAASLAFEIHHRGLAVGLATNGQTLEDFPPVVPIGQSAHQLARLLEALARLQMNAKSKIGDVLHSGIGVSAGVSVAHFSYQLDDQTLETERALEILKLPGAFFVCRIGQEPEHDAESIPSNVYLLSDVFMQTER